MREKVAFTVLAPYALRPNAECRVAVTLQDNVTVSGETRGIPELLKSVKETVKDIVKQRKDVVKDTTQDAVEDTTVVIELTGQGRDGSSLTCSTQVVVPTDTSRTAILQVGDLVPGKARLSARAEGGAAFSESAEVEVRGKSASLFIQTDKAQYKPGQAVCIRVLALDPELRPLGTTAGGGRVAVHVTDGKQNRVKQWVNAETRNGIWSGSLQLSEQPVLGDWTVTASLQDADKDTAKSSEASRSFSVAEYVLPTFEVSVKAPRAVAIGTDKIAVTVTAKYTYGKPVVGKVTVKSPITQIWGRPQSFGGPLAFPAPDAPSPFSDTLLPTDVEKTMDINGTTVVEFDSTDLRIAERGRFTRLCFEAWVVEDFTNRRLDASSTAETEVREHEFDITFVDPPMLCQPEELVKIKVKVEDLQGAPVQDTKNLLKFSVESGGEYGHMHWRGRGFCIRPPVSPQPKDEADVIAVEEKAVPSDGIVSFEFVVKKDVTNLLVNAEYRAQTVSHHLSVIKKASELDGGAAKLQIRLDPESPKVGDELELRVSTLEPLSAVSVLLIGPLGIQEVQWLPLVSTEDKTEFPGQQKADGKVRVAVTNSMAPTTRVVVFGAKPNGELVMEVTAFKMQCNLPPVDVRIAPDRSEPGQDVDVHVSAEPHATVALLAVDQSVLLLKEETNDITVEQVAEELLRYESRKPSPWGWFGGSDLLVGTWKRPWEAGQRSTEESMRNAGLAFMTNAKIHEPPKYRSTPKSLGGAVLFGSPVMRMAAIPPKAVMLESANFASADMCVSSAPAPRLRKAFPETWLWEQLEAGDDGAVTLRRTVPDTITSWFVSALAVHPERGLGLSTTPGKLTVFRPFFISLSLPYSVIRGESVEVAVQVFNYMDEETVAAVTFHNEHAAFHFGDDAGGKVQQVKVAPQGFAGINFNIVPNKVGYVLLKVTAISDRAGDAVERPLKVKAEGETQYRNKAIPVDLREAKSFSSTVLLDFPENVVAESEVIELSAVGDILGPSTANLDQLIRMPCGCGEQNMLNFVPNIVITKYLRHTRKVTPAMEKTARSFTETGYQRELTYKHGDGSFSAFGEHDASGSTWLTAFVAKSFRMAAATSLLDVEERVIDEALWWLAKQQRKDGSFPEVGTVCHRDMQGGSAKGLALTAYVLVAFLVAQDSAQKHKSTAQRALSHLVDNLDSVKEDPYAVAIVTYALHVAKHPAKEKALALLDGMAHVSGDYRYWEKGVEGDQDNPYRMRTSPVNVEMTSYALMTYLERGQVQDALPVMRWLLSQRNSKGGFSSTQDTVVGLTALAEMAERISFPDGDMKVVFLYDERDDSAQVPIVINSDTSMVLQKHEVPRHVRRVEVSAVGTGFALAQVSWSYNENSVGKHPLFNLRVDVDRSTAPSGMLRMRIFCSFIAGPWGSQSNMAVLDVALPSGFSADSDGLAALRDAENVRRVETKDQDTVIVVYFDQLEVKEYFVDVSAIRQHIVGNQKPVPITVYDYYDQTRRARIFYETLPTELTVMK